MINFSDTEDTRQEATKKYIIVNWDTSGALTLLIEEKKKIV